MNELEKVYTTVENQPLEEKECQDNTATNQNQKEINFGKFADAKTLLTAYQNLEREFTKKSQQLKQLQKQLLCDNDDKSPQTENKDNSAQQNPTGQTHADNPAQANVVCAEQLAKDKDFLEKFVFANQDVTNQVLQRYLLALSQNDLPATIKGGTGAMSLTPPKRPQTIKEASLLAEKLFK